MQGRNNHPRLNALDAESAETKGFDDVRLPLRDGVIGLSQLIIGEGCGVFLRLLACTVLHRLGRTWAMMTALATIAQHGG